MGGIISSVRQAFPGKPRFTEENIPDLEDKIVIVTGSNTGVGKEIARMCYSRNAKVYMLARSEQKTREAMSQIQSAYPNSKGKLTFIELNLADLPAIKAAAENFLRYESRLHVLFNNAGVGYPGKGSKTNQGYELQLGVNCIGTFALTKYLTPALVSTSQSSPPNTVRVAWASSSAVEAVSPKNFMEKVIEVESKSAFEAYCISKLGNYFQATEFAARHKSDGIVSIPLNPGNLDSDFWRTQGTTTSWVLKKTVLYPSVYGAYTNIFAGFSPEVTLERSGQFVAPWGRLWYSSEQMINGSKQKTLGGTGDAREFWKWNDDQVQLQQ